MVYSADGGFTVVREASLTDGWSQMEQTRNGNGVPPKRSRWSQVLKWAARLLIAAGIVAAIQVWRSGKVTVETAASVGVAPLRVDWNQEPFADWSSSEAGIAVRHPARYDAVRGFGRFTSRELAGGLAETDLVAFRCSAPRSVIANATYQAPRSLTWAEWVALAKQVPGPPSAAGAAGTGVFSTVFGGSERVYRQAQVSGRPALAVSGKGAVRYPVRGNDGWELWRFESRFAAAGSTGVRITAGVHDQHYEAARPGIERALDSFRWTPPR